MTLMVVCHLSILVTRPCVLTRLGSLVVSKLLMWKVEWSSTHWNLWSHGGLRTFYCYWRISGLHRSVTPAQDLSTKLLISFVVLRDWAGMHHILPSSDPDSYILYRTFLSSSCIWHYVKVLNTSSFDFCFVGNLFLLIK